MPEEPSAERITFAGHSTVLLELGGARILTDPVLRDRILHIRRHADAVSDDVLRDLDAVLISHLHPDHLDPRSLKRLGKEIQVVGPAGTGRSLRRRGFRNVTELEVGENTAVGNAKVEAVSVEHDGRRYPIGPRVPALGYVVRGSASVFFAGDTAPFEASGIEDVDVALLPIAGWGPNLRDAHHLNPKTAAEAAAAIKPTIAVPIHWGTMLRYGLADRAHEILVRPAEKFEAQMAEVAPEVEARVLKVGESMTV